uniref:Uncharacterized protein n=1 Tax=Agrobacterium tumefaciens TaxID=358 RepID=A0A3S6IAF7_AGRTU|nr:hypothetical protein AgrTiEU6_138 [Agrobacterium tumefaciens]
MLSCGVALIRAGFVDGSSTSNESSLLLEAYDLGAVRK